LNFFFDSFDSFCLFFVSFFIEGMAEFLEGDSDGEWEAIERESQSHETSIKLNAYHSAQEYTEQQRSLATTTTRIPVPMRVGVVVGILKAIEKGRSTEHGEGYVSLRVHCELFT
jgi:hypothetical protein